MMPAKPTAQSYLARLESSELATAASRIAGFKLRKREFGSAANISGVRDATFVFSRRLDSRTLFATDSRYGPQGKLSAWTGADKTAISTCRRMTSVASKMSGADSSKVTAALDSWMRRRVRPGHRQAVVPGRRNSWPR
jgi:hypothetical protein